MKTMTLLHETLSDAVSPRPWRRTRVGAQILSGAQTVAFVPEGRTRRGDATLIALAPAMAQFVLDQYVLLARLWSADPHNTAIRETFEACGELMLALEPCVVSVNAEQG